MRTATAAAIAIVLSVTLLGVTRAAAQDPFFTTGECETSAIAVHAWHEFGHDLASLAAGDSPLNLGALWGNKWGESQLGFKTIARGGLIAQLIVAAIEAGFEEPEPNCTTTMNALGAGIYAARARIAPANAGDFDPFSSSGRGQMGAGVFAASVLLDALADYRMKDTVFVPPAPLAPSVFASTEPEPSEVATLPFRGILLHAGIVHEFASLAVAAAAPSSADGEATDAGDVAAALPAAVAAGSDEPPVTSWPEKAGSCPGPCEWRLAPSWPRP
jgi:hypothetical protein